jgi:hypothetical protein
VIRLLIALLAGAGLASALYSFTTGDTRLMWVWIVAVTLVPILLTLVMVGHAFGGIPRATPQQIQQAVAAGRLGAARIDGLRRTGTSVNDQPLCEIDLSVAPGDRAAYRVTIRQLVDLVDIPRRQPGTVVAVARIATDAPEVVIVDEHLPDLAARVSRLPRREQLAEWNSGPTVLGADPGPKGRRPGDPIVGTGRRGRPWRILAYVALFLVGAAAVLIPVRDEVGREALTLLTGEDHSSMFADTRAAEAVAAIAEAAGTDETVDVSVYAGYVIAEMATSPGASTFDSYTYRNGAVRHDGPATIQPTDPDQERFRIADVAWERVPQLRDEAMRRAEVDADDLDGDPYLSAARETSSGSDPVIRLRISLSTPYESHSFEASADGLLVPDPGESGEEAPGETTSAPEETEEPAEPAPEPEDLFASGAPEAIERLIEAGGSDEATRIVIRSERISTDLATSPGATTFDDYEYEDRQVVHGGPSPSQPFDPQLEVFHLRDVSWDRLPDMLAEAYEATGRSEGELSGDPYIIVDRSPFFGDEYPVTMQVYLPGDYGTVRAEFAADGSLIRVI